jgi:hypothetical protein
MAIYDQIYNLYLGLRIRLTIYVRRNARKAEDESSASRYNRFCCRRETIRFWSARWLGGFHIIFVDL